MLKLNRNYQLKFTIGKQEGYIKQEADEVIIIEYPFTLLFDINRNYLSTNNTASLQIFNLNDETRAKLHMDFNDYSRYIDVELYAGYGDDMPLIFLGQVQSGASVKDSGSVDVITSIEAYDGGLIQSSSYTSASYDKTVSSDQVLKSVISANLEWAKLGVIVPLPDKITQRGTALVGNAWDIITRMTSNQAFIDNGVINVLAQDNILADEITVINADTGLLATPKRMEGMLVAEVMFEPQVKVGQGVYIESQTAQYYNQIYKVLGVQHRGIISPVSSGRTVTILTLAMGSFTEVEKEPETVIAKDTTWTRPVQAKVTSPFGYRVDPVTGKAQSFHKGIDYGCTLGTGVKATNSGTVSSANYQGTYGNIIIIDHGTYNGKTITSRYAHLQQFLVNIGDKVGQGQVIAYSGGVGTSAGRSTGPHLHFEIRENGNPVNPTKYVGS